MSTAVLIYANGRADLNAYDSGAGFANGRAAINAYDTAQGYANGRAKLNAYDAAAGRLNGRSALDAYASGHLSASGRAALNTYGAAVAKASGRAALWSGIEFTGKANGRASLLDYQAMLWQAAGRARLDAMELAQGQANGRAAFNAFATAWGKATGRAALLAEDAYFSYATNLATWATSRYENFNFNSFTMFNGLPLAAGAGGIYRLDADRDNGTPIAAHLRTGKLDFASDNTDGSVLKKLQYVYVGMIGGPLEVVAETANNTQDADIAYSEALESRRAILGGGVLSRYWTLTLKNVRGKAFEVASIEPMPVFTNRRM